MKDGDSAYFAVDTLIYMVKSYKTTFRLSAYFAGHIQLYEVAINPHVHASTKLLYLDFQISSVGIHRRVGGVTHFEVKKEFLATGKHAREARHLDEIQK